MKRRITAVFTSMALLLYVVIGVTNAEGGVVSAKEIASAIEVLAEQELQEEIPADAEMYVEKKFPAIKKIIELSKEELSLEEINLGNTSIGNPFIIYDLDSQKQPEKIYFPVIDNNSDKVVYVITVIGTTSGWTYEVKTDMVEELNQLKYSENSALIYIEGAELKGMTSQKEISFETDVEKDVDKKTFADKVSEVTNEAVIEKVNTQEVRSKDVKAKSTNYFSDLGYYYLVLQRSQGQGNHGLCWAAAVATISNYIKDTSLKATQVANAMGIGYDDGANLWQAQDALIKQGLYFKRRTSYAPFDLVKTNIQRKSPIYMSGDGYNSEGKLVGHAITIYGYKEVVGEQCLMIWDSASNGNQGDTYIISYNGASTVFSSVPNSAVYTWNGTLLNYK